MKSLGVLPSAAARACTVLQEGSSPRTPDSIMLTAWRLKPARSASSAQLQPAAARNCLRRSPNLRGFAGRRAIAVTIVAALPQRVNARYQPRRYSLFVMRTAVVREPIKRLGVVLDLIFQGVRLGEELVDRRRQIDMARLPQHGPWVHCRANEYIAPEFLGPGHL